MGASCRAPFKNAKLQGGVSRSARASKPFLTLFQCDQGTWPASEVGFQAVLRPLTGGGSSLHTCRACWPAFQEPNECTKLGESSGWRACTHEGVQALRWARVHVAEVRNTGHDRSLLGPNKLLISPSIAQQSCSPSQSLQAAMASAAVASFQARPCAAFTARRSNSGRRWEPCEITLAAELGGWLHSPPKPRRCCHSHRRRSRQPGKTPQHCSPGCHSSAHLKGEAARHPSLPDVQSDQRSCRAQGPQGGRTRACCGEDSGHSDQRAGDWRHAAHQPQGLGAHQHHAQEERRGIHRPRPSRGGGQEGDAYRGCPPRRPVQRRQASGRRQLPVLPAHHGCACCAADALGAKKR